MNPVFRRVFVNDVPLGIVRHVLRDCSQSQLPSIPEVLSWSEVSQGSGEGLGSNLTVSVQQLVFELLHLLFANSD